MIQPPVPVLQPFGTIAIVGVGLIGGSIALAAKTRGAAQSVIGVGRDAHRLDQARRRGIIDEGLVDLAAAVRRADLIVFCTPVDRIVAGVREAATACREGALITDAGSVKGCISRELASGLPGWVEFVGSHPLAGSEQQGFEHADPRLFENRVCVVTPLETSPRPAVERIAVKPSVFRPMRPSFFRSPISTTASDSAEKTIGTTTMNISRRKILPTGSAQ